MSGTPYQRPRYGVGRGRMQLPRVDFGPVAQQVNGAFTIIEMADNQNLKTGQDAAVSALLLTDANNVTWRVTASTDGTLALVQVPVRGPAG
jgi:hypothetical protein